MFSRARVAPVLAEYLGAAILVLVAIVMAQTTAVSWFLGTSLAITMVAVYMFFARVSGAHVNPAITFGMWTARKITTLRGVAYIAAQLLGALTAWQLYEYFTGRTLSTHSSNFSTPAWLAEAVGTFVLALAFTAALNKALDVLHSGVGIGFAFFAGILIATTASTGFANPAISLGLRNWSAVTILGPLLGALVGVNLYNWFFTDGVTFRRTVIRLPRRGVPSRSKKVR